MPTVLSQLAERLADIRGSYAAAALGLYLFSLWAGAYRWQRLLDEMGSRVGVVRLALVSFIGIAANNLTLNSRVAGEGARLVALNMTDGVSMDRLVISTLYERLADLVGSIPIWLLAIPGAWALGSTLHVERSLLAVGALVAAGALLLVLGRRELAKLRIGEWWRTAIARYRIGAPTLAVAVLCSLAIHVQDPARLMAGAAAFGVRLTVLQAVMLTVGSMFTGAIPTIGAVGAVEGGLIAMLMAFHVPFETAVAVTALERGISIVFSTAVGSLAAFWLGGARLWRSLRGTRADRAAAAADTARERPVVLVVCGNGPDPITLRKMEALNATCDLHLVYWRDGDSIRTYPFSPVVPPSSRHPVDLPDPNGPPWRGLRLLVRFHAQLWTIARRVRPDVVHAVNFDMLIGAWLLCLGRPRRTLVYDLLDTQDSLRRWPVVLLQRLVMRRVDRVYATSPDFVSGFLRPLRLIAAGVEPVVIPNAPWAATFEGIHGRRRGPFVIGYIGSFRCEPAIEWLCESVLEVRRTGLDVEVLFAGNGDARPLVEALARRHAFVHHEGPYDYARDVRSLYERVDLVFAVYDHSWDKRTHLACRFSDAVATGRPLVAARGTYMGGLVEAHRLGYTVDASDPPSLPAAIRDAVSRRAEWCEPGRIPPALRAAHTFEHYVPALQSSYATALRMDAAGRGSQPEPA